MVEGRPRDRALDMGWWPRAALLAVPLFALYFGGVVGGSVVQGAVLHRGGMGWLQQVGGVLAVLVGVIMLPRRRELLALFAPQGPWLARSMLVGLSIAVAGTLTAGFIGDWPERHGAEWFAYQATMPGIGEELGFRGLVLGVLLASLGRGGGSSVRLAILLIAAAVPFAALHVLERGGFALTVVFAFTLYAGVVLGWLRLTTGSLFAAMLAHNVANVASGAIEWLLAMHMG